MTFPKLPVRDTIGPDVVPFCRMVHKKSGEDLSEELLEFSVTEKEGSFALFEMTFKDNLSLIDKMSRIFDPWEFEWGIKNVPKFLQRSPREINGDYRRGPYKIMLMNAANTGENRAVTLKLTFIQGDRNRAGKKHTRRFTGSGSANAPKTYRDIIEKLVGEIGGTSYIDFEAADYAPTLEDPIVQDGITNMELLGRMARQFNCKLTYQHSRSFIDRVAFVAFVEYGREYQSSLASRRGLTGSYHVFDWGHPNSNILKWDADRGFNSPNGSTVTSYTDAEGRTRFVVSVSGTERTRYYELNATAIRKALEVLPYREQLALNRRAQAGNFEDFDPSADFYRDYFTLSESTTAPEGLGLTMKLAMIPDPNIQAGDLAWIGPVVGDDTQISSRYRTTDTDKLWRIYEHKYSMTTDGLAAQSLMLKR